jgi:hypothetical protein
VSFTRVVKLFFHFILVAIGIIQSAACECFHFIVIVPSLGLLQLSKNSSRPTGNILHTGINVGTGGWPKGSGTLIFETAKDAQQTISA